MRLITLFFSTLACLNTTYSQENTSGELSKSLSTTHLSTTQNTTTETVEAQPIIVDTVSVVEQIEQIDSRINYINTKKEIILNDPAEKQLAEGKGWFEKMEIILEDLELEKSKLKARIGI